MNTANPRFCFTAVLAFAALLSSFTSRAWAQCSNVIDSAVLKMVESACVPDAAFKSVQNSLAQVDSTQVSLDWQKMNAVDAHFSNKLRDEAVTEQKDTGRCWMFSALNIFRRASAEHLKAEEFEFSQSYLFFYDKLEKANVFLEAIIRTRNLPYTDRKVEWLMRNIVSDGGNWLGFIELVKKYGTVPKDILPETFSSSNSRGVNAVLTLRLKVAAMKLRQAKSVTEIAGIKLQTLKDVYRILALNFGIPPKQFKWRYETKEKKLTPYKAYTPQEFYHEVVNDALDDYLALYSIPTLPFNRKYEIDLDKAVEDRPNMNFVNVPLELLRNLAKDCLLDNRPVWFGCAVSRESSREKGIMSSSLFDFESMYGMNLTLSRKELFESYSSEPEHNMVFTGVDLAEGKPVKWLVENSWGEKSGKKGYYTMTDDWFEHYVQVIVVHKKFIPAPVLAVFQTAPETLPPWDPML